jgi:hypothetical protein
MTDARYDCIDADMTVEEIKARIYWLDEVLMMLRELAATANPGQPRSSAKSLIH